MLLLRRPAVVAFAGALVLGGSFASPAGAHSGDVPLVDSCTSPQDPPSGQIFTSKNVEYVASLPGEAGDLASGGRLVGDYFVMTGLSHFSIYDVRIPENPRLVSRVDFPCRFENEDVDTDGDSLIYSDFAITRSLYIYDIRDKRNPKLAAELPGAGRHTMSCLMDCDLLYGSYAVNGAAGPNTSGEVVDLRDPAKPKVLGDWTENDVLPSRKVHDVTEVAPGIAIAASAPITVLDTRSDPVKPTVLARGPDPAKRYHSVQWPRGGKDRFILAGFETNATPMCSLGVGDFSTFDASKIGSEKEFKKIDSYLLTNTNDDKSDGNPSANVGLGCSPHWFETRPNWNDGGVVAMGAYDHGVKFLEVDAVGKISEKGHFRAPNSNASGAYWITCNVVYVVDYTRGLDVIRFNDPRPCVDNRRAPPPPIVCSGAGLPRVDVAALRLSRSGLRASGRARAGTCSGRVGRVELFVSRTDGRRCRFLSRRGRLGRARSCSLKRAPAFRAVGTKRWSASRRARLSAGRYTVRVRVVDGLNNVGRVVRRTRTLR